MKIKAKNRIKFYFQILVLVFLVSCNEKVQVKDECSKYVHENYLETVIDTSMAKEVFEYQNILLERFGETSVKGLNHEAYHFQFYSSHGYGKSIKFENKIGGSSITVKCKSKKEWYEECKEYQIGIGQNEWNKIEKMIYEFNFWTEENFRGNEGVLDGYVFLLEGNRPKAKECKKKSYKLVARGSPRYDKIGSLCEYILEYEDQIKFKYKQMNRIN